MYNFRVFEVVLCVRVSICIFEMVIVLCVCVNVYVSILRGLGQCSVRVLCMVNIFVEKRSRGRGKV